MIDMGENWVLATAAAKLAGILYELDELEDSERYLVISRQAAASNHREAAILISAVQGKLLARRASTPKQSRSATMRWGSLRPPIS